MSANEQTPAQPTSEAGETAQPTATPEANAAPAPVTTEATTQQTEPKGADADKEQAAKSEPADVALKFPEGVKLDEKLVGEFTGWAKENGLDSAKAQAMADKFLAHQKAADEAFQREQQAVQEKWLAEVKGDPEIGGAKLEENLSVAAKAMDRLGGPNLRKLLDATGLGNHPDLVRVFVRAGKAISEDSLAGFITPGTAVPKKSAADILYGNPTSN